MALAPPREALDELLARGRWLAFGKCSSRRAGQPEVQLGDAPVDRSDPDLEYSWVIDLEVND
jgi:hypothetical protein